MIALIKTDRNKSSILQKLKKTVLAQRSLFSSKSLAERIPKILNDVLLCTRKNASLERIKNSSTDLINNKKGTNINIGSNSSYCNDKNDNNGNDKINCDGDGNNKFINGHGSDDGSRGKSGNRLGEKLNISETTFRSNSKNILGSHTKNCDLLHLPEGTEEFSMNTTCRANKFKLEEMLIFRMTPNILNLLRRIQRFEQVCYKYRLLWFDLLLHSMIFIMLL